MDIKHCLDHMRTIIPGCSNNITSVDYSESTFLLVMQTKAQQALLKKYGNNYYHPNGWYIKIIAQQSTAFHASS